MSLPFDNIIGCVAVATGALAMLSIFYLIAKPGGQPAHFSLRAVLIFMTVMALMVGFASIAVRNIMSATH